MGGVERNLQQFREKNEVYDPEKQAIAFFSDQSSAQMKLKEEGVKLKIVDYLDEYLTNPRNVNKMVPSNLGINEPSLNGQITEFNKLQLERETLLKNTTAENPLVKNIETGLEKLRQSIVENLHNVRNAQELTIGSLNEVSREASSKVQSMPGKQKQLLEVTRQQSILQELYSFPVAEKIRDGDIVGVNDIRHQNIGASDCEPYTGVAE